MQKWIIADEEFLSFLRKFEPRIPNSDYGANHYKPFFGELFSIGDLVYITQISSAKPRHEKIKNSRDFLKLYVPSSIVGAKDELVAVVNLNYMFPIPRKLINYLEMRNIDDVRLFKDNTERTKYIDLLNKELVAINSIGIEAKAEKLYDFVSKFPKNPVSFRCLNFRFLEEVARKYSK